MYGHLFAHPEVLGLYVIIGYAELGHEDEVDAYSEARVNAFFDGLQILR